MSILNKLNKLYSDYIFASQNKNVLDYLKSRGISEKTIRKFNIGYSNYNIGYELLRKEYTDGELLNSGVFVHAKSGKITDLFFKKIVFPIMYRGDTLFMTSRVYPEWGKIKHVHQKGSIDYAYNHDVLDKSKYVIIVEGPMDCITLAQRGFASIGLLGAYRITRQIVNDLSDKVVYICFDKDKNDTGDNAGKSLAQKLNYFGVSPRIVNLPFEGDKVDINSYFKDHTMDDFGALVRKAKTYYYRQQRFSRKRNNDEQYDIIPIAEQYLDLKYIGGKYKAVCPFHDDGDPSLVFYPETNSFYCFGCNSYGNTVVLIKKLEEQKGNNISYSKAKEMIGR